MTTRTHAVTVNCNCSGMCVQAVVDKQCLKLTRFLYPKDEVELSLLFALLERQPCEMCLFWASELIYSGFDIGPILWSVYYDFYAQLNPGLFGRIGDALKKLRDGNIEPVLMVVKTLRVKKATDNVFSLRISKAPEQFTIYKGRVPGWLAGYSVGERPLLRAICNYDWNQIMLYIRRKVGEPKELIKSIIKLMMDKCGLEMKDVVVSGDGVDGGGEDSSDIVDELPSVDDIVEAEWTNHGYADEFHIMLALIVSLITPDSQIDFGKKLIKLNEREKSYLAMLNGDNNVSGTQGYMQLLWKRLCKTTDYVGAFESVRARVLESGSARAFSKEITDYWPYHCSQTPYWQKVFNEYAVIAKCAEKPGYGCDVSFVEDDDNMHSEESVSKEERFYRKYGFLYELDEPFTQQMWDTTVGKLNNDKDVVDVMEEVFENVCVSNNSNAFVEELRMELDGVELSSEKRSYVSGGDVFNFAVLNKLLDSI